MQKVGIQFDETKPHQLENSNYKDEARRLGMKNIRITGDYDLKVSSLIGEVDDFEDFLVKFHESSLSKNGSLTHYK